MSRPRRNTARRRQGQGAQVTDRRPADFWREPPGGVEIELIRPAGDPTALLRSLGPPPLANRNGSDRYFALVVERSSALATALAAAAGILAGTDD